MALTATVYVFDVSLSDVDRGVYTSLSLKLARHPSETDLFMLTRLLAYLLELEDGLVFTGGLFEADEPALWTRDLTGRLRAWIEVGTPDASRLHKASKACDRVVVYCHKDIGLYLRALTGEKIYTPEAVSIVVFDRAFMGALASKLERRTTMSVSVTEGELYIDIGTESFTSTIVRYALPG